MPSVFRALADPAFLPHGYCLSWDPWLLGLHIGSDSLIALSYFSIPIVLLAFVMRRKERTYSGVLLLFAIFIIACGLTHVMAVYTLWSPAYWLDGSVKAVTAVMSVGTAAILWPLLPQALAMPDHATLRREIETRESTEVSLRKANAELQRTKAQLEAEVLQNRQTAEWNRQLFYLAPHAMLIANGEGRITHMNEQLLRWFGYSPMELADEPIEVLIPERFRAGHPMLRTAYMAAPTVRPMGTGRKLFGLRKDGSEFPVDISLSAIDSPEGRLFIASIADMTDRVHVEEALERTNEALNVVNKELETFSYSVSHDLRQPVRALTGFSQILVEDYGSKLDDQGRDYLERIQLAGKRMGTMIEALLGLSRISRSDLNREPVDVSALANELAEEMRQTDHETPLNVDIAPGLTADADPRLLRVLLQNLMSNAWKFSAHAEQPRVQVRCQMMDGAQTFCVGDNGAGFDMAYADKLFGVFQRLHRPDEFPGTGIGLATAQRIVRRHGGRIWAEGKVGAGATFYFTL